MGRYAWKRSQAFGARGAVELPPPPGAGSRTPFTSAEAAMPNDEPGPSMPSLPRVHWRVWTAWLLFLLLAPVMVLGATRYRLVIVVGDSMRPNFRSGDIVWADRHAYRSELPQESDVVLARVEGELVVKRVVGLPGQTVEVRRGVVYLDGSPRPIPAPAPTVGLDVARGVLGTGKFAILGDNRVRSSNPTIHAVITKDAMIGKVVGHLRLGPRDSTGR